MECIYNIRLLDACNSRLLAVVAAAVAAAAGRRNSLYTIIMIRERVLLMCIVTLQEV